MRNNTMLIGTTKKLSFDGEEHIFITKHNFPCSVYDVEWDVRDEKKGQ